MSQSDSFGWLIHCPASDSNYSYALKRATNDELQRAIEELQNKPGSKSRIAACLREIKKRKTPTEK